LLEVGTGFHPELTGRENVFFNGSMLGMSREEVGKKFDEIVNFAEIEKFLDTPVKFYSSGMYVRLAFSVAAHLEPEILILDEVLAVGDAAFQKKSLNKILETMNQNRTVLFVSHSMESVEQLCNRALLLHEGQIKIIDKAEVVTEAYREENAASLGNAKISADAQPERVDESYGKEIVIKELGTPKEANAFFFGESLTFTVTLQTHQKIKEPVFVGVGVNNPTGTRVFTYEPEEGVQLSGTETKLRFKITSPTLMPGDYSLSLGVRLGTRTVDFIPEAIGFRVKKRDKKGELYKLLHDPAESGYVLPNITMEVKDE
jgi:lipopolysaccharide transport system ATP-binding protein